MAGEYRLGLRALQRKERAVVEDLEANALRQVLPDVADRPLPCKRR